MSCNQEIISCKSAIPLLSRHHCRNSQFLFPSPFFLIIEEERTCKRVTQLNLGHYRHKQTLTRYKFPILISYLASEHPGSFLGRFSRHQGCVCGSGKEGGSGGFGVNLKLFWKKHLVSSQQLCTWVIALPSQSWFEGGIKEEGNKLNNSFQNK